MAGSRQDMLYVSDEGVSYCINADESNVEVVMGAQVTPNGAFPRPPKGFEPRFVVLKDITGLIARKVPVLTLARYALLTGATALAIPIEGAVNAVSVRVSSKSGQKQRFIPKDFDSGQKDGD
jgi:hypothetical protein